MIIEKRGDWKSTTISGMGTQLNTISAKTIAYKTLLGIEQDDIDRIEAANKMNGFIINARSKVTAWNEGLTKYDIQLRKGNVLEMMNDFQALPDLGTPPAATMAGIWGFIENRRDVWMKHPKFTDAIGEDMTILGPMQSFDTETYKPKLTVKITDGNIIVKTGSVNIGMHNLYAGVVGQPLVLIVAFRGAKYTYSRPIVSGQE